MIITSEEKHKGCESCANYARLTVESGFCMNEKSSLYGRKVGGKYVCGNFAAKGCVGKKVQFANERYCRMCSVKCVERNIYTRVVSTGDSENTDKIIRMLEDEETGKLVESCGSDLGRIGYRSR